MCKKSTYYCLFCVLFFGLNWIPVSFAFGTQIVDDKEMDQDQDLRQPQKLAHEARIAQNHKKRPISRPHIDVGTQHPLHDQAWTFGA